MSRMDIVFAQFTRRAACVASLALHLYLCLAMLGCASTRPRPTVTQDRDIEARVLPTDDRTLFHACVDVLQELGYTIEVANAEAGVVTASRQTREPSGEIVEEGHSGKGMPTWGKVMLVITGLFLVVLVIAAIRSDDEKDEKAEKKAEDQKDSEGEGPRYKEDDSKDREGETRRYKGDGEDDKKDDRDSGRARHDRKHGKPRPRHHGGTIVVVPNERPDTIVLPDEPPSGPTIYTYRVTIHLQPRGEGQMEVRASMQGTEARDGHTLKAGSVNDPDFVREFFAGLGRSLDLEEEESPR